MTKFDVTVTLANRQKSLYRLEESGATWYVSRYDGVLLNKHSIGSAKSFETALSLIRSDAGSGVLSTDVREA